MMGLGVLVGIVLFFSSYKGHQTNNNMEGLSIISALKLGCSLNWIKLICKFDS